MTPRERLALLAIKLREAIPDLMSFDMQTWLSPRFGTASCGYSACAIGYAGTLPAFRDEGFDTTVTQHPTFGSTQDWGAVEEFFGLASKDASHLFSDTRYPKYPVAKELVAERIERWLAENPETG